MAKNKRKAARNEPASPSAPPTPGQVRAARLNAGLTQTEAAVIIGKYITTWQNYEYGKTPIPYAAWELFKLKTGMK